MNENEKAVLLEWNKIKIILENYEKLVFETDLYLRYFESRYAAEIDAIKEYLEEEVDEDEDS